MAECICKSDERGPVVDPECPVHGEGATSEPPTEKEWQEQVYAETGGPC
jgi:hypothetical protein